MRTRSLPAQLLACLTLAGSAQAQSLVQGTVLAAGQTVSAARITLFTPNLSFFAETRTSASGAYSIPQIPDGAYRLGVASPGRAYQEIGISISGQPLTRDFSLSPESAIGQWIVIGNTLPEFFDATDIAILLPDG
jgi:hypothetical protein